MYVRVSKACDLRFGARRNHGNICIQMRYCTARRSIDCKCVYGVLIHHNSLLGLCWLIDGTHDTKKTHVHAHRRSITSTTEKPPVYGFMYMCTISIKQSTRESVKICVHVREPREWQ